MSKIKTLSVEDLKSLVLEERARIRKSTKSDDGYSKGAQKVDAKDFAKSLSNKIDYVKKLKLEEKRLMRKLKASKRAKQAIRKSIIKEL